jgi:hypothetical protein
MLVSGRSDVPRLANFSSEVSARVNDSLDLAS